MTDKNIWCDVCEEPVPEHHSHSAPSMERKRIQEIFNHAIKYNEHDQSPRETRILCELAIENMCTSCAGTGEAFSKIPCMCGGTGKASDAVPYLLSLIHDLRKQLKQ